MKTAWCRSTARTSEIDIKGWNWLGKNFGHAFLKSGRTVKCVYMDLSTPAVEYLQMDMWIGDKYT